MNKLVSQCAIIITTTHTYTCSLIAEGNQWQDDEVKTPCRDRFPVTDVGLRYPEAIGLQAVILVKFGKPQRFMMTWSEHRQIEFFVELAQSVGKGAGIQFSIGGQVERNASAADQGDMAYEVGRCRCAVFFTLLFAEEASSGADDLAYFFWIRHAGALE
nr:hypothetical protein [Sedimenticola hydrogenitrophicus]